MATLDTRIHGEGPLGDLSTAGGSSCSSRALKGLITMVNAVLRVMWLYCWQWPMVRTNRNIVQQRLNQK